jgi:A nuclease family of the HNH/ENDO VII superfamily with conserved AHH
MTNTSPNPAQQSEDIFKTPIANSMAITIAANRIASQLQTNSNPYTARNELFIKQQKEAVEYLNGRTMPASVEAMFAHANEKLFHSQLLHENMQAAFPNEKRPRKTEAHHIVALSALAAEQSRAILFKWRIAINDADNGVYLPAFKRTIVRSLPDAHKHRPLHTFAYYLAVEARLIQADNVDQAKIRRALQRIKRQLIDGSFPR